MNKPIIAIGADHQGFVLKQSLIKVTGDITWHDVGTYNRQNSDYPLYAKEVCKLVLTGNADRGLLLCGSGIGMAIMANRFKKIYAALAWNTDVAQQSREHDNANILVLPADYISLKKAEDILRCWLKTEFKGNERYKRRISQLDVE